MSVKESVPNLHAYTPIYWRDILTRKIRQREREGGRELNQMAVASVMSSVALKPYTIGVDRSVVRGLPSLARTTSLRVKASSGKKIKTSKPYG